MSEEPRTRPSRATRAEEARDAEVESGADEVEGPAPEGDDPVDREVAESYAEAIERGATQRGEGQLP